MNPDLLLTHFDRISEAPDAVPRLRKFILDLAVRGKLVEQNPDDEPASELLKRIQGEKERLGLTPGCQDARKGKDKKGSDSLGSLAPWRETGFDLPKGWEWSTLAAIGIISPRNTALNDLQVSFVPMPKIFSEYGKCNQHEVRLWDEIKSGYTHFAEGDVGLAKITPCFENGKSTVFRGLTGGIGAGTTELHIVRPIVVCADYVLIFLKSPSFIETGISKMTGTAGQKRVPTDYFSLSPFPLPPLAEQHRIVAKVDELMALCDQLEVAKAEREARRDRLVASSLNLMAIAQLLEESSPLPLWGRDRVGGMPADAAMTGVSPSPQPPPIKGGGGFLFLNHLPRLTTRVEHIKQLRQTILNLAVRGRLVPQDPDDEPASELLSHIATKRKQLLQSNYPNEGEAKSQAKKQLLQLVPNRLDQLPSGWEWATLMQCSALVVDCHNKTAPYSQSGIPLIRTTNIRDGKFNLYEPKFVDETTYKRWSMRCEPEPGDILITREAPMGEVAIIPVGMKICMGQRLMLIRLVSKTINPQFMLYSLQDPLLMSRVQDKPVGATVQHLRVGGVETLLIPLPPLAEQHRIVAKVDELMTLCDQLEENLKTSEADSRSLLEAVLRDALNPEIRAVV